jgi:hypothetical protein
MHGLIIFTEFSEQYSYKITTKHFFHLVAIWEAKYSIFKFKIKYYKTLVDPLYTTPLEASTVTTSPS